MERGESAVRQAQSAAKLSLVATSVVVAVKLAAGWATGSISVLAEGLQSFVDVLIAFGVVQTVRWAARPPDDDHPYGHGKAELLMSGGQMLLIMGTAGFVISQAIKRLQQPQAITVDWGLAAMAFALVVNLAVSWRLDQVAKATGSSALRGEVLHLRGDCWSSVGILAGLLAVKATGWMILDPILAIAFTLVVVFTALKQLGVIAHDLMEGSVGPDDLAKIESALNGHSQVRGWHNLRTRRVGSSVHVDLHVLLDDELTFVQAHEVAEDVEAAVSRALGGARVNAHFEPYRTELAHQQREHQESH